MVDMSLSTFPSSMRQRSQDFGTQKVSSIWYSIGGLPLYNIERECAIRAYKIHLGKHRITLQPVLELTTPTVDADAG